MKRKNGRNHGEVFTNNLTVAYILDQVGYRSDLNLKDVTILEPAAGTGAFAIEIINRLFRSAALFNFSFEKALKANIRLIEQDTVAYQGLLENMEQLVMRLTGNSYPRAGFGFCLQNDFLGMDSAIRFDYIVGNPPYIRHERIPETDKVKYRKIFSTFKYRADLYIPFFEKGLSLLKQNGLLSYICSNRWLNNQYGVGLRSLITSNYRLVKLLNIEQASLFDEQVIAYPCITVIENSKPSGYTLLHDTHSKYIDFNDLNFDKIQMPAGEDWHNLFIHYDLNDDNLAGIVDQGYNIGIGVATGADKIFIKSSKEINQIEGSRLIPLIKASDIRNDQIFWKGHYLINPYDGNKLCNLDHFPILKNYFEDHKDRLLTRHTSKKNPDKWFKTIDKVKPELQFEPKLLLPDFAGSNWLCIDEGLYYPHHNLYYITGSNIPLLKILAAILMSDFMREQLFRSGIRMNDGLPRLQAQLLKKIKIPIIEKLPASDQKLLVTAYDQKNMALINEIINTYCTQAGFTMTEDLIKKAG